MAFSRRSAAGFLALFQQALQLGDPRLHRDFMADRAPFPGLGTGAGKTAPLRRICGISRKQAELPGSDDWVIMALESGEKWIVWIAFPFDPTASLGRRAS
jgi:hypothetical protein